jgi:hypothetical protein
VARFRIASAKLKGPFRVLVSKLVVVAERVTPKGGFFVARGTRASSAATPEIFFRAMSQREFRGLAETGKITVRGENFVTQDLSYVKQLAARHPDRYEVTVRFETEPGTRSALVAVGRRSDGKLIDDEGLGDLPRVSKGLVDIVHVKAEGESITYGLRKGTAAVFNSRILKFGVVND